MEPRRQQAPRKGGGTGEIVAKSTGILAENTTGNGIEGQLDKPDTRQTDGRRTQVLAIRSVLGIQDPAHDIKTLAIDLASLLRLGKRQQVRGHVLDKLADEQAVRGVERRQFVEIQLVALPTKDEKGPRIGRRNRTEQRRLMALGLTTRQNTSGVVRLDNGYSISTQPLVVQYPSSSPHRHRVPRPCRGPRCRARSGFQTLRRRAGARPRPRPPSQTCRRQSP